MNPLNLLIAQAYAAAPAVPSPVAGVPPGDVPSDAQIFLLRMAPIALLVVAFYFFMVVPQQRRFKKHRAMVDAMKAGDRVLTSGGLIGTVAVIEPGNDEVVIDLGSGLKVTALRSTIQARPEKTASEPAKA